MKVETIADQLYYTTIHVESILSDGSVGLGTAFVVEVKREHMLNLGIVFKAQTILEAASPFIA